MGLLPFLFLTFLLHRATSTDVIYNLSPEDYARMPAKVQVDHFNHCLYQPDGVYCTAHADVVADAPSELLDMMRGYSAYTVSHFNYTKLTYGLCMTSTCREFYNDTSLTKLQEAAEACLNVSIYRDYGLKTRVTEVNCYFEDDTKNDKYSVDWMDWATGALLFILFALNVVGSVYDSKRDQTKPGNKLLLSFSWRINWKQLMAPPSADPRAAALQSLNGIKFLTSVLIMMIHMPFGSFIAIDDARFMEESFKTSVTHVLMNGNLMTQSFFLMSGFLLAYNMQISSEKKSLTWNRYIKSIVIRYVRLALVNLVALLLTATWLRFRTHGPFWQELTGVEVDDCRSNWMYNMLMVLNYEDYSICTAQTWSSSADFHLHILGLTVILLAPDTAIRIAVLMVLFVVGCLLPPYTVATWDLDGTIISEPELIARYMNNATYKKLYLPTHNNIPIFIMGMLFGYVVYDQQKRNVTTTQDHTKYRYAYWMLLPLMYVVMGAGGKLFFQEGPRASLLVRCLFALLSKPIFGFIVMLIIYGAIHKVETLYRGILEWRGFMPLAKLSYCVYTLHILVFRYIEGISTTFLPMHPDLAMIKYFGCLVLTILFAFVTHMCVEVPVTRLVKMALADPPQPAQAQVHKDTKAE